MPDPASSSSSEPLTEVDLLRWAESLAGIAKTGLAFTENLYEQERFEEILHIAAEIKGQSGRSFDQSEQIAEWMGDVGERTAGYVTPKCAVGAVVGNDNGEILLIPTSATRHQRSSSKKSKKKQASTVSPFG